mmetsp:Transcript_85667/g.154226  ORF Transcript_85667/g.154226 Transcript_85667/m.154226 type:complete len:215 (+) Transcript_85667:437-1081(+)
MPGHHLLAPNGRHSFTLQEKGSLLVSQGLIDLCLFLGFFQVRFHLQNSFAPRLQTLCVYLLHRLVPQLLELLYGLLCLDAFPLELLLDVVELFAQVADLTTPRGQILLEAGERRPQRDGLPDWAVILLARRVWQLFLLISGTVDLFQRLGTPVCPSKRLGHRLGKVLSSGEVLHAPLRLGRCLIARPLRSCRGTSCLLLRTIFGFSSYQAIVLP